jgi:hypothetical protein
MRRSPSSSTAAAGLEADAETFRRAGDKRRQVISSEHARRIGERAQNLLRLSIRKGMTRHIVGPMGCS